MTAGLPLFLIGESCCPRREHRAGTQSGGVFEERWFCRAAADLEKQAGCVVVATQRLETTEGGTAETGRIAQEGGPTARQHKSLRETEPLRSKRRQQHSLIKTKPSGNGRNQLFMGLDAGRVGLRGDLHD